MAAACIPLGPAFGLLLQTALLATIWTLLMTAAQLHPRQLSMHIVMNKWSPLCSRARLSRQQHQLKVQSCMSSLVAGCQCLKARSSDQCRLAGQAGACWLSQMAEESMFGIFMPT